MHPYSSEALAKMRIDDLNREATLFRLAHQVGRHRRKRTRRSTSRATNQSMSRAGGEQSCAES